MVWRFLRHYGVDKATAVLEEFTAAVVQFDPESASRAQISMMEEERKKLGMRVAEAEREVAREKRETLDLKQDYEEHLKAARILEARLADQKDAGETDALEASLAKVAGRLEEMNPEIVREEAEDREVEAWSRELRAAYDELGAKLRNAQGELTAARRQLDMATLQRERTMEEDRCAREVSGTTRSVHSMGVALNAMNRETAKVRHEMEVLKASADSTAADNFVGDPNIAEALAAARGKTAAARGSLLDRLAALKQRRGEATLSPAA